LKYQTCSTLAYRLFQDSNYMQNQNDKKDVDQNDLLFDEYEKMTLV